MSAPIARIAQMILAAVFVAPLMAPAQEAEQRSRTQGLKETDRFVKAGGRMTGAVAKAEQQTRKTLNAYNALVTRPSTSMKGDYKNLMKSVDSMNERMESARQTVAEMQEAGNVYFSGRAQTINAISDPALQSRAKRRLDDSQKHFTRVLYSLRKADESLEDFRKDLADQIVLLGSDLTPSAMIAAKPNADTLNARAAELFARTDAAIANANAYFQGLKAAQ